MILIGILVTIIILEALLVVWVIRRGFLIYAVAEKTEKDRTKVVEAIRSIHGNFEDFQKHLKYVSSLRQYYGEPTIEDLLKHVNHLLEVMQAGVGPYLAKLETSDGRKRNRGNRTYGKREKAATYALGETSQRPEQVVFHDRAPRGNRPVQPNH